MHRRLIHYPILHCRRERSNLPVNNFLRWDIASRPARRAKPASQPRIKPSSSSLGPGHRLVDRFALLGAMRDHLGHRRLRVHLGRRSWSAPAPPAIEGSRRRAAGNCRACPSAAPPRPGLEIAQLVEGRDVVAVARRDQLFDRGALRQIGQQAFRRRLVRREFPDRPRNRAGTARTAPSGPWAAAKVHSCSAIFGASRTATAQAEGGFMISAPLPEISHLLLRGVVPGEDARAAATAPAS